VEEEEEKTIFLFTNVLLYDVVGCRRNLSILHQAKSKVGCGRRGGLFYSGSKHWAKHLSPHFSSFTHPTG